MSRALRRIWSAIAALLAMAALAGGAAAGAPSVAPGWPAIAPEGADAFVVPGGPVLATNGAPWTDGAEAAGYTRSGRTRWYRTVGPTCGNCYGPATAMLAPTGLLGPIGDFGGGLTAFDPTGEPVPACAGAVADDGDCYGVAVVHTPEGVRLALSRSGHWRVVVETIPLEQYDMEQPTIAFTGGVAVISSPTAARVFAVRRVDGVVLWDRPALRGTLGPLALGDGTVRVAGPGGEVTALDPATGAVLWRAGLPGAPVRMLADAGGAGLVLAVRTGNRRAIVRVDDAGRVATVVSKLAAAVELGAVGPGGVVSLTRSGLQPSGLGEIRAVDRRGVTRWRFAQPGGTVGTPAFVGRDIVVTIGRLMYRIRPWRPASPATARTARLDVDPARFRLAGVTRTCTGPSRAACRPASPLGTVAHLRLARSAAGSDVRLSLVRVGTRGAVWTSRMPFRGRLGSQWAAVGTRGFVIAPGLVTPSPGRYRLVARGGSGAGRWAVSAPVTVVRSGR